MIQNMKEYKSELEKQMRWHKKLENKVKKNLRMKPKLEENKSE